MSTVVEVTTGPEVLTGDTTPIVILADNEVEAIAVGDPGPPGPPGPQGQQGAEGAASTVPGPPGATGPAGPTGAAGNTVLYGTSDPAAGTGVNGNFYINTTTNFIFGPKVGGAWPAGTSLIGPVGPAGSTGLTGATGAPGATGSPGADGNTVLYGSADPVAGTGVNGNFYINTTSHFMFGPKAGGAWPAGTSLIGPAGATGPAGAGTPSTALPLMDGTAAIGTSLAFTREDHVHPTDTSRAPVASPIHTGTFKTPGPALIGTTTLTPDSPLTINANTVAGPAPVADVNLHIVGADAHANIFTLDTFGTGGAAQFRGMKARNTAGTPQPVQANDVLSVFAGLGYDTAAFQVGASFQMLAGETWSSTIRGAFGRVLTTPLGGTATAESTRFQPSGGVSIGAAAIAADPGVGCLNLTGTIAAGSIATIPASTDLNTVTAPGNYCCADTSCTNGPYGTGRWFIEVICYQNSASGTLIQRASDMNYDGWVYTRLRIGGVWHAWQLTSVNNLAWAAWTPTLSVGSGALTSASATGSFKQLGKTCHFQCTVSITTNGTGGNYIGFTLPIAAVGGKAFVFPGTFVPGVMCKGTIQTGITDRAFLAKYDNSYPGADGVTIWSTGTYETA